jgi:hypothetical protein
MMENKRRRMRMADENAQANDKVEGVIVRGSAGQSAGVATTGPSPTSLPPVSDGPAGSQPNAQREALGPEEEPAEQGESEGDQPAPAISMTNPPPREPASLSGAKVSASRLYMLLHNATNRASIAENDLRSAWDDLKHHMGGVV